MRINWSAPYVGDPVIGEEKDGEVAQLAGEGEEGVQAGQLVVRQIHRLHLGDVLRDYGQHLPVYITNRDKHTQLFGVKNYVPFKCGLGTYLVEQC